MLGLTQIGVIHTAISVVAVLAGIVSLAKNGDISVSTGVGKTYFWTTLLTCLTGFFILQHGGFGKPHVLGILTLVTLLIATLADVKSLFGSASRYIATIGFSVTFFFHWIPAATETFTRLPAGSPVFASAEDPALQKVIAVFATLLIVGLFVQVRRLRSSIPSASDRAIA